MTQSVTGYVKAVSHTFHLRPNDVFLCEICDENNKKWIVFVRKQFQLFWQHKLRHGGKYKLTCLRPETLYKGTPRQMSVLLATTKSKVLLVDGNNITCPPSPLVCYQGKVTAANISKQSYELNETFTYLQVMIAPVTGAPESLPIGSNVYLHNVHLNVNDKYLIACGRSRVIVENATCNSEPVSKRGRHEDEICSDTERSTSDSIYYLVHKHLLPVAALPWLEDTLERLMVKLGPQSRGVCDWILCTYPSSNPDRFLTWEFVSEPHECCVTQTFTKPFTVPFVQDVCDSASSLQLPSVARLRTSIIVPSENNHILIGILQRSQTGCVMLTECNEQDYSGSPITKREIHSMVEGGCWNRNYFNCVVCIKNYHIAAEQFFNSSSHLTLVFSQNDISVFDSNIANSSIKTNDNSCQDIVSGSEECLVVLVHSVSRPLKSINGNTTKNWCCAHVSEVPQIEESSGSAFLIVLEEKLVEYYTELERGCQYLVTSKNVNELRKGHSFPLLNPILKHLGWCRIMVAPRDINFKLVNDSAVKLSEDFSVRDVKYKNESGLYNVFGLITSCVLVPAKTFDESNSYKMCICLNDTETGDSVNTYISNLNNFLAPLCLMRGALVRIHNVLRHQSVQSSNAYLQTTPISDFSIVRLDGQWKKSTAELKYETMLLREVIKEKQTVYFKTYANVAAVLKVSILPLCPLCRKPGQGGRCNYVGCSGNDELDVIVNARCVIDDGSAHINVFLKDKLVAMILRLSDSELKSLKSRAANTSELLYLMRKRQYEQNDNAKALKRICESQYLTRPLLFSLKKFPTKQGEEACCFCIDVENVPAERVAELFE